MQRNSQYEKMKTSYKLDCLKCKTKFFIFYLSNDAAFLDVPVFDVRSFDVTDFCFYLFPYQTKGLGKRKLYTLIFETVV